MNMQDLRAQRSFVPHLLRVGFSLLAIILVIFILVTFVINSNDARPASSYSIYNSPEQLIKSAKVDDYVQFTGIVGVDKNTGNLVWQDFVNGPALLFSADKSTGSVGTFRVKIVSVKDNIATGKLIEKLKS